MPIDYNHEITPGFRDVTRTSLVLLKQPLVRSIAKLRRLRAGQAVPEGLFIARERHVQALARTAEHLALARAIAEQRDAALDLLAEELRLAHDALGEITGAFSADELLGVIFSSFCIGK